MSSRRLDEAIHISTFVYSQAYSGLLSPYLSGILRCGHRGSMLCERSVTEQPWGKFPEKQWPGHQSNS